MSKLSLKVHWHERVPGTQESRLVRTTPYVRIAKDTHPPVYLQGGRVYGEGGPELDVRPDWLDAEVAKLSPRALEDVGFAKPVAAGKKAG